MAKTCDDCGEGHGWKHVQEPYAVQQAERAGEPGTAEYAAALAAARNTVYPCRTCNKAAFFRWAGRHWLPDHDVASCGECIEAGRPAPNGRKAGRRRPATEEPPPPPTDEDAARQHVPDFAERAAGDF